MDQTALGVFAALVDLAARRDLIAYEPLAERFGLSKDELKIALTEVRDHCRAHGLPMVNVLAVNAKTQVPGSGFVKGLGLGIRKTDLERQRALFVEERARAIAYPAWGAVLAALGAPPAEEDLAAGLDDELESFHEGQTVELRHHFRRERNRELVRRAVEQWRALGQLRCEVCEFDFGATYGPHGAGFIEAHHRVPLAQLPATGARTTLADLAPVCANCHRMIHRAEPPLSIAAVAQLIADQRRP